MTVGEALIIFLGGMLFMGVMKVFNANRYYMKGVRDGYSYPDRKNPRFDMIREILEDVPAKSIDEDEADWWKKGERRD